MKYFVKIDKPAEKENLEKAADPIVAKEQIAVDTKKEAEIPAEELLVHKNGQWELKKGDIVDFKTKKVVEHVPADDQPKTESVEPKPELKAITGEKAKLPPPPKHEYKGLDEAMRRHGSDKGRTWARDEHARKQKQHEETFKEVKAKMEADRAKSRAPVDPKDPLTKVDVPAPNPTTPLANNNVDAGAQRAVGAAGSAIAGAASSLASGISNFVTGGSGSFGGDIKMPTKKSEEELKMSEGGQWSIEKAAGKPPIKSGFFTVDHLNAMDKAPSHQEAKSIAHAAIDSQEGAHPANIAKAKRMIDSSKSTKHLMIGSANFMLSHPSEGLGMGTKKA